MPYHHSARGGKVMTRSRQDRSPPASLPSHFTVFSSRHGWRYQADLGTDSKIKHLMHQLKSGHFLLSDEHKDDPRIQQYGLSKYLRPLPPLPPEIKSSSWKLIPAKPKMDCNGSSDKKLTKYLEPDPSKPKTTVEIVQPPMDLKNPDVGNQSTDTTAHNEINKINNTSPEQASVEIEKPPMDYKNPDDENQSIVTRALNETNSQDNTIADCTRSKKKNKEKTKITAETESTTSDLLALNRTVSPSPATTITDDPEKETETTPISDDITATPPIERPATVPEPVKPQLKVLLRGMPADTEISVITEHLSRINIIPSKIVQMKRRRETDDYKPLPLFLIIMLNTAANLGIYDVTHFKDHPITVERFRGGKFQVQCFRCQGFGHTQRNCKSKPKCVKCAGGHLSHECHKPRSDPPTCCNCRSSHTANFTGCPARPKKIKRPALRPTVTSTDRLNSIMSDLKVLIKDPIIKEMLKALLQE